MPDDDAEVVRASLGDPERFGELFDRHHRAIWAYLARRAGAGRADELAGDVFVTAFGIRATYDPTRGTPRAWLYGIASNLLRTRLRSDARAARAFERAWRAQVVVASPFEEVDDAAAARLRLDRAVEALAGMAPLDREVVTLFAWERLSYEEIAAALGIAVGTVRSRLARARTRLAELVADRGEPVGDGTETREGRWTSSS